MLKLNPQDCLKDFLNGKYRDANYQFLAPVYEKLFLDLGSKINLTPEYINSISVLNKYFIYLDSVKRNNKQILNKLTKKEKIDKFIGLLEDNKISLAVDALEQIIFFIHKNRTNINGLEMICWSLFGETSLEEIRDRFVIDENRKSNIKEAVLDFGFNSLIIEYNAFAKVLIADLLTPVQLIKPSRRQGIFDKEVFRLISIEFKKIIKDFKFEDNIEKKNLEFFSKNSNWLITEKFTKNLDLPLPNNSKKIDVICKINNSLFLGTHKEQKSDGGAQDNQATDSSFLFDYNKADIKKLSALFDVKSVFFFIILERGKTPLSSRHWTKVIDLVKEKSNKNKYLLSSAQFIDLIKKEFK